MVSKSFYESLEAVAEDRGLDIERILDKVEIALQIACKNSDVPYKGTVKLESDTEKKKIRFFNYTYVVDEIDPDGPRGQILLEDAKLIKPKAKVGQVWKEEIDLSIFKRKAASMFKQSLNNELKGLEREEAYNFFKDKVGEIVTGKVISSNDYFVTLNLSKGVDATVSIKDCIPGETFVEGESKKLYVCNVEKTSKGPKILLSRNNREIVKKLFELNIPEVAQGTIEIMGISRDAGSRSKVGVLSVNGDIDPKGACVGAGGARIRTINNDLNGEKIDIFVWKSDAANLIAEALTPARVLSVMTDEKEKKATVIVSDDQYSLAIGRGGQNTRLAAMATGWKIDIKKLSDASEEKIKFDFNIHF
ncbi:MAG: transcription termination factor NusA [Bacilli bacterium]|nr:transcription termination factor NusA [Bacilli bacterium]